MNIFQTAMISQVLFGVGARHAIGQTLTNMGTKKALIITDKFLHDSGLSNDVEASIKNASIESIMFDGAEPENPIEVIDVVKNLIIEEKVDAIIGFGGGSAMDLAKCARTMTVNEGPIQNYYDLRVPRKTSPLPMILIPTTAGTSSEVSHGAVAFDKSIQKKIGFSGPDLAATIACVDPELTTGLPAKITAVTGLDCLCHAAESMTCGLNDNPVSEMMGKEAIRLIAKSLKKCIENGNDIEARSDMALACVYAGIAFESCPPHLAHSMGHTIGAMYHIPHGEACAVFLAPVLEAVAEAKPDRIKLIGESLGLTFAEDADLDEIKSATGDTIRTLCKELGLRTLKELIPEKDIPVISQQVMNDVGIFVSPVPMDAQKVETIIQSEYEKSCK